MRRTRVPAAAAAARRTKTIGGGGVDFLSATNKASDVLAYFTHGKLFNLPHAEYLIRRVDLFYT